MTEQSLYNNIAELVGELCEEFSYHHEVFGERFYHSIVRTPRLSASYDEIPILISERLFDPEEAYRGRRIRVIGQFRSYNQHEGGHSRLLLSVFAREVEFPEEIEEECPNSIYLDGYICKEPVYRKTPLGREICDLLLAVNRSYNKSDYLPTIAWGRNARFVGQRGIGERIRLWGRIQSRVYQKRLNEQQSETRVAYEVSVAKLEYVKENA